MTEAEWNDCTDLCKLLQYLRGKVSDRKLRLFAAACCRSVWHLLIDERSRIAVETSEQFADDCVALSQLQAACNASKQVELEEWTAHIDAASAATASASSFFLMDDHATWAALVSASAVARAAKPRTSFLEPLSREAQEAATAERGLQRAWLRCICGNVFRSCSFDPIWGTVTVQKLIESIYQDRAFDRLPILADALEDAGCTNADILNHCRQPGAHVRGCWVVDLLLGKK